MNVHEEFQIMLPYTYCVTHLPSGKRYYGKRTAKNCHPNDLGVTYFTSSKHVLNLIAKEGKENFKFEVRRTFKNADEASLWEWKVIRRVNAVKSSKWLNLANGFKRSNNEVVSDYMRKRVITQSERHKKSLAGMGKKHSEETKKKIGAKSRNRIVSQETKQRIKESHWSKSLPLIEPKRSKESRERMALIMRGKAVGKKRYNDGKHNYMCFEEHALSTWKAGWINVSPPRRRFAA